MTRPDKWDIRFIGLAKHVSQWSKDPSTQVGAVIVDQKHRVISLGFNGFARGVRDLAERLENREMKYDMIIHLDPIFTAGCGYDTWTSHVRGKITAYCYSFNSGSGGHKEATDTLNSSARLVRGKFDNSKTKVTFVPEIRDKITQGGGWR